jgi:hypothetical protein
VEHELPGLQQDMSEVRRFSQFSGLMAQTTYPRFLSMPKHQGGALLLDLRTGISGLGDEWLFVYKDHRWQTLGIYLKGVQNNA